MFNQTALLVIGLITAGLGLTVATVNWSSRSNRPLALYLLLLGVNMALDSEGGRTWQAMIITLNSLTFIAAIEWANRIGSKVKGPRRDAATWLFRIAQLVTLAMFIVGMVFAFGMPEQQDTAGFVRSSTLELALFLPLIGSILLFGFIAGVILSTAIRDSADLLRLRVVGLASPFLLSGLFLSETVIPFTIAFGVMILIAGLFRYQMILGRRGSFMSQFLAPEVAELVREQGMAQVMRRERRVLTIVMCDLRGFTAYAREHDSDEVITLLESFYVAIGAAAVEYGGTIKDHAGDGVMLLVGAPIARADHASQALKLSLEIMHRGQQVLREAGLSDEVGLGIGVATGQITVGTIRGAGQLEYVAVGNAVNLASRLCDRAANGQILSDRRTADEVPEGMSVTEQAPEPLKGFVEPIEVCSVGS